MATLSTAARNAALDAIGAIIDAGASGGQIVLYTAAFGSVLVNSFLANPSKPTFAAASGGSKSISATPRTVTASGTGTAVGFTIVGNSSNVFLNATGVGVVGSGAEIELTSTNIRSGQQIRFSSFQLTLA